ncbi:hypothetical protein K7W42_22120 [Deinococcus sp. HMF7604]|uniref:hypothetical protein n=1 Tax=Deinococcus betulae TaxID=2873312 RepID=UPI001CCFC00E|nr:hypothetical protein [Deinococcus betulae]MBZ9753532.1 hypothetical protein [Deinococcus betulae]
MDHDEHKTKFATALEEARLDELLPLVKDQLPVPPNNAFTLLTLIFTQAIQDKVSFLAPPPDFHAWLLEAARPTHIGPPAKPNTIRLRLSLLANIYKQAMQIGVLERSPLEGLRRPPGERADAPAISREEIDALHKTTRKDTALHTALVLIDEHAFKVRELLDFHWTAFDLGTGAILRPQTITRLSDVALKALQAHHRAHGGVFAPDVPVLPYKLERDLRAALHKACAKAGIRYYPPGDLRRASLRDKPHTTDSAGYSAQVGQANLNRAVALAQGLANQKKELK